ncbi:MAG TPA: 2-phospho-L-lactate transferase CofD family protein, partial [Solirubrobacteraceae bacterium]
IDERGWGLAGDRFNVMDGLKELGVDVWFNLGDRDLAIGIERARALREGARLTDSHAALAAALGVRARVLPMCDRPVRTRVLAHDRWWSFQEFMIAGRGRGPVDAVDFRGARAAAPTPEVLAAIASARAIVIGPSNPIASIGPILAIDPIRQALKRADAPVVGVSPLVAGAVLKGPTAAFLELNNRPLDSAGVVACYEGLLDGLVADERTEELPVLETDVLMDTPAARARLAEETLGFARALAS